MQYADQLAHVRRVAQQSGDTTWGAAQRAVLDSPGQTRNSARAEAGNGL